MSVLDKIAPYPPGHMVTARAMATHYSAFALLHHTLAVDHYDVTEDREAYSRSANLAILAYGVAYTLHTLADLGPQGEQAALDLWERWINPPGFGPDLWEWLADAGVDPQEVVKAAAEAAQAEKDGGAS